MLGKFQKGLRLAAFVAALPLSLWSSAAVAQAGGAVITYGATSLGVNQTGELNFAGSGPGGTLLYGVYRDPIGDAISPGCSCEGWGVAATVLGAREAVFANQSAGNGGIGDGNTFASTASSATSVVNMAAAPGLSVRHTYGASLVADVFQVQVTITNNTGSVANDLVYRRAMDWDVPPTPFNEFVTHGGVEANLTSNGGNVLYASNNGFATSDPRETAGSIPTNVDTVNKDFVKAGAEDHGSVFDFAFGDLADGASRIFNIFYGSAADLASAMSKVAAAGMQVFSLGQSNTDLTGGGEGGEDGGGDMVLSSTGSANDNSATFIFGFSGVGGTEVGTTQALPILPVVTDGQYVFDAPVARRWFDPPFATAFDISVEGGDMLSIEAPVGFSDLDITIGGIVVDSDFDAGETYTFAAGVRDFRIGGFLVDTALAAPFPLFMDFEASVTKMTWDPVLSTTAPIPEPSTYALMLLGLVGVGAVARRRAQSAKVNA